MEDLEKELEELENKLEKARTVRTNLDSFKDWSFAAYKVEEHEKGIIEEATSFYEKHLKERIEELKEKSNDSSELCE